MSGVHILVVEDEPALCSYLVPLLEREGFTASAVLTGAAALAAIADRVPDLVLLDIGLPDMSGLDVCRSIRRRQQYLPVVMLTGQDSPEDELRGFGVQADDYLTKPVVADLLLARLRAVLRLAGRTHVGKVTLGAATIDLVAKRAWRDGKPLPMRPQELALLEFLLEHPGQIFGKTALLAHVWARTAKLPGTRWRYGCRNCARRSRPTRTSRGICSAGAVWVTTSAWRANSDRTSDCLVGRVARSRGGAVGVVAA